MASCLPFVIISQQMASWLLYHEQLRGHYLMDNKIVGRLVGMLLTKKQTEQFYFSSRLCLSALSLSSCCLS